MKQTIAALAVVLVLVSIYVWGTYNKFVTLDESVSNQWAQVEAQYQRRFDLIPNLVEAVRGQMIQEQEIFGEIAEARTKYAGAVTPNEKAEAATQLEGVFGRLLVIMENYPQLQSSNNVQTLMSQLEGTENRINVERKRYNDVAMSLNAMTKKVPSRFIASMFGFSKKEYFKAEMGAEKAPKVDLNVKQ